MKRLALAAALAGIMFILNGCAVYAAPYDHFGVYYGYVPYYGGYAYRPYRYYGFRPRFYGGGGRGYGWRGRGWH